MPLEMQGRRIQCVDYVDCYNLLEKAGDYCGPVQHDGQVYVWFKLPIADDPGVKEAAQGVRCVRSPPHRFIEEADGSLTIRESILSWGWERDELWHGFLTEGRWELQKSKD